MHNKTLALVISSVAVVLILGIVILGFNNITGYAAYAEVSTSFPVNAWNYIGWGECDTQYQHGSWEAINDYCKSQGYLGVANNSEKPCYHEGSANRWEWYGDVPMTKGTYTGSGAALTRVKCMSVNNSESRAIEPAFGCTDSDGGLIYAVKGTIMGDPTDRSYIDHCEGTWLREYYCKSDGWADSFYYNCPSGQACNDGACVATTACSDSDGGKDHDVKGNVTVEGIPHPDECDGSLLKEYYCQGDDLHIEYYDCSYSEQVCKEGACVSSGSSNSIYYCWGDSTTDFQITKETSTPYKWYSQKSWTPYCFLPVNTCSDWCKSKGYDSGKVNSLQCACSSSTPPLQVCGNGKMEGTEECDDGNLINWDGCNVTCGLEPVMLHCGNGLVEGTEECDDSNAVSGDGCSSTCAIEATNGETTNNSIIPNGMTCTDSDGGINYDVSGSISICSDGNCILPMPDYFDSCSDEKTLSEKYCEDNELKSTEFTCSDKCSEGACVNSSAPSGVTYYCCGGSPRDFKITTDKACMSVYWYGQKPWNLYCYLPSYTCSNWCKVSGYTSGLVGSDTKQCICK